MMTFKGFLERFKPETRILMLGTGTDVKKINSALEKCGGKVTGVARTVTSKTDDGDTVTFDNAVFIRAVMSKHAWDSVCKRWELEETDSPFKESLWMAVAR